MRTEDLVFYDKISPIIAGKKYSVPPPTLCPLCRMQRRQTYRNDRNLYQSVSALSQKEMISMYHPEKGYVVYDYKEWWSGQWDALQYGRNYDFSKDFFTQFAELQKVVPRFNLFNKDTENCEYVNYAPHCKNCYLLFGSWFNENCLYGQSLNECINCVDNLFLDKSQLCYENTDGSANYNSSYCESCSNVTDSYFCYDCKNIKNCIGCYNLQNKQYYIANKPATKEQYEEILAELGSHASRLARLKEYRTLHQNQAIHKCYTGLNNEQSTGDFLFNCKNAYFCFSAYRCQDISYCSRMFDQKDSYDFEGGGKGELVYEGMSNDFGYASIGCTTCEYMKNAHYSDLCFNCSDCFGCIGLQQKQYCIFNKQYSKQQYEETVSKIIQQMIQQKQWGEFFPTHLSPFGYNETMAQDYFPLTKQEALSQKFNWTDPLSPHLEAKKIIAAYNLPDRIQDIPDDIVHWAIECEVTAKPFRIVKQELQFYREHNIPVPRRHPDQRHQDRMALRNPRKLWQRNCMKCNREIQTSYAPDRPEVVYCEQCYLETVY